MVCQPCEALSLSVTTSPLKSTAFMSVSLSLDTIRKLTLIANRSTKLKPKKSEKDSLREPLEANF